MNPSISPRAVYGRSSVATTTMMVVANRYFDGLLRKNGFRLRMTSTMSDAETTDSRNQPVLNWSTVAWRMNRRTPKVR